MAEVFNMAAKLVKFGLLFCATTVVFALPEPGVWDITIDQTKTFLPFTKSMYNNTNISVKINANCDPAHDNATIKISWILRWTPCAEEYIKIQEEDELQRSYMLVPNLDQYGLNYPITTFHKSEDTQSFKCNSGPITLNDEREKGFDKCSMRKYQINKTAVYQSPCPNNAKISLVSASSLVKRARRDATPNKDDAAMGKAKPNNNTQAGESKMHPNKHAENDLFEIARTWDDGIYLFMLKFEFETNIDDKVPFKLNAEVTVRMKGPTGYLSAIEWPLLPFYGTMCVIYVIMALVWMVLSACNWRDLLRIQFWIGGVILLGMLEKAVFFGEYSSINITGKSVRGAVIFAELVSCLKRTLARILVVIVSLGFGIVKPRLGPMLHRVLGMGALYFILGSVEGCLRILRLKSDISSHALLANIPLAVLDAAICWWVFTSLVQTTRTLRLRRNLVKLSLYRHFTNTLIFAVLASVAFMIWSIKQHKLTTCLTDWKEIWVDDAFWHLLFSIILLVIMILWRPNNNNQRYAFSPLLDAADDEAEEPMMNDAYEGMKMRNNSAGRVPSSKPKEVKNKPEDDLKWIEENIPASVTDAAIPGLLDSDEEIMTTKFEMSKME